MGSTARLILPRSEPTAAAAPASDSTDAAPKPAPLPAGPSLAYEVEQPWYGQRRAFRIIVLLLLLNIIAVTSITWGPITVKAWQDHRAAAKAAEAKEKSDAAQAARAQAAVATRTTALNAALAFQLPPGQVVYTEDPAEASRLLFAPGGGYSAVPQSLTWQNVSPPPPPVIASSTPELSAALLAYIPQPLEGSAFLHERRTPAGTSRLVWVHVRAARQGSQRGSIGQLWMERELRAFVLKAAVPPGGGNVSQLWDGQVRIEQAESRRTEIPIADRGDGRPAPPAKAGEVFRLLTGRPDPNDATRLLIDYTLDGKPGTIAMTLQNDDRLRFDPDRGTTTVERFDSRSGRVVWKP
jgi:hypothetical protein